MNKSEESKFILHSNFNISNAQLEVVNSLLQGLNENYKYQTLLGVTGSGKTFTMANVIAKSKRSSLILVHNKTLAAQLYNEMRQFFPKNKVEYFVSYFDYYQPEAYVPSSNIYIEKDSSINEHIEQMRLKSTKSILESKDVIIIATVSAIYGLGDPEQYLSMTIKFKIFETININEVFKKLISMQYNRNDYDFKRGTFRKRGSILDIFPADSESDAVRIILFDDEIEDIYYFDSLTGKKIKNINSINIFPSSHYVASKERINNVIKEVQKELKRRVTYFKKNDKFLESQRIEERTKYDIEMLSQLGYCSGIENYSRILSNRKKGEAPPTLLDYLPKNALVFIDESHVTIPQFKAMYKGNLSRKKNLVDYGFRLPSAMDNRPLKFDEFENMLPQTIFISATPSLYEFDKSSQIVEQIIRPTFLLDPKIIIKKVDIQVDDIICEIKKCIEKNERVLITTLTKKMAEDLTDYLFKQKIKAKYLHADINTVERVNIIKDLRLGVCDVIIGINLLREGLDMPEVALVAIFDADKEGFLRSETSLIQTIGRAARHKDGRVIIYANKITNSIKKAIEETDRRREIQDSYNKKNNLTPKTVIKKVDDYLDQNKKDKINRGNKKNIKALGVKDTLKEIKNLEKEMKKYAKNLEFEKAIEIRNKVKIYKESINNL